MEAPARKNLENSETGLMLRPEKPEDRPFLFRLYARTREEELSLTGWSRSEKEAFLEMQFRSQQEDYHRRFPDGEFFVIVCHEEPAGRITLHRGAREIRVVDLIVSPEWRGRGLGTILLRRILEEAEQKNKIVRLHALKAERAVRLYQRLGFSVISDNGIYLEMERRPSTLGRATPVESAD
ncbi:MAG TPA: GNAT family N-acetyltransferase [Verrucomicrobiae bacterium]|nr:GNAT family N-acetyltransferase [Verrucomicrobiae bacterium]